ncbi:helix-turn-helix transcriptional regulator [Brevibacillus borstelensis]|uniref:helix-turn-helix domain-containing protein n=1 Tax=Brevibacillus borstelensis TaxID=45462 RepID=UPI00203CD519|nr:helix-turn-helix transcriptional regulator [Brevibacillus borstelensis]
MDVILTSGEVVAIRTALGKSQKEFAEIIGVSQGCLSLIERGRRRVTPNFAGKLTRNVDVNDPDLQERIRRLSAVADF